MQQTKTMAKRILLFFLIFSALPVIATTRQIIDKFVSDPAFIPSSIGICFTDVKTGETIASYNERQAVIPVCPTVVYRQNEGRYNRRAVAVVITLIVDAGMTACRSL